MRIKMLKVGRKKMVTKLSSKNYLIYGLSFALVGLVLLLATKAASFSISLEAETNAPSNLVVDDPAGSGGKYAQFSTISQVLPMTIGLTITNLGDPDSSGTINEASGLIMSHKNNSGSIFWTHNDSPPSGTSASDINYIYAFSPGKGILATVRLGGTANNDWEDISFGPGPDTAKDYIYVGNIGSSSSDPRKIYRIAEPAVNVNQTPINTTIASSGVETYTVDLPDNDYEGFFIDPINGDGIIFQKSSGDTMGNVYRIPASQFKPGGGTLTTTLITRIRTRLNSANTGGITGADIAADGSYFVIRNYEELWVWSVDRAQGQTVTSVLQAQTTGPYYRDYDTSLNAESIAFDKPATGLPTRLYTMGEGSGATLKYVNLTYQ